MHCTPLQFTITRNGPSCIGLENYLVRVAKGCETTKSMQLLWLTSHANISYKFSVSVEFIEKSYYFHMGCESSLGERLFCFSFATKLNIYMDNQIHSQNHTKYKIQDNRFNKFIHAIICCIVAKPLSPCNCIQ